VDETDAQLDARAVGLALVGVGKWAVEEVATGDFVGTVGLGFALFDAPFTPAVEMGWRLARPYWGRGFATEAANAAVEYGFRELELREIVAFTSVGNAASRGVMERIGMVRWEGGDFDGPGRSADDEHRRQVLYSLQAPTDL
jgi:RimJ/RimL family protein N-acetyltransferase